MCACTAAVGRCLIGGDFNSKSSEWGETRLYRREILVGEIDLTIAAPHLASKIGGWCFLEVTTLSDHRCKEFSLEQRCVQKNIYCIRNYSKKRFDRQKLITANLIEKIHYLFNETKIIIPEF